MEVQFLGQTDSISRSIEEMEALRQSSQHGKIGTSSPGINPHPNQQGQGLVALLVMVAVLCFIMTYCCWGAPCCRSFCRRYCCCQMNLPADLETAAGTTIDYNLEQGTSTPTVILLPFGRMLVVDGAVFAQFQADTTGLDLLELGESVARAGHNSLALNSMADSVTRYSSTPSILEVDSEANSKHGLSPLFGSNPPPTYDSLFGGNKAKSDMPPSYSEILRQLHELVNVEETDVDTCVVTMTEDGAEADTCGVSVTEDGAEADTCGVTMTEDGAEADTCGVTEEEVAGAEELSEFRESSV